MIISTLDTKKEEKELVFPLLMIHGPSGCVIIATGKCENGFEGTVLKGGACEDMGEYGTHWNAMFRPYHGTVKLRNKP